MLTSCFRHCCNTEPAAATIVIGSIIVSPLTIPTVMICSLARALFTIIKNCFLYIRYKCFHDPNHKFTKDQIFKISTGSYFDIDHLTFLGLIPGLFTGYVIADTISSRRHGKSWVEIKNSY